MQGQFLPNIEAQVRQTGRLLPMFGIALALAACAAGGGDVNITTGSVATPSDQAALAPKREEKVVKIALVLPFGAAGPTAVVAKGMKQAGELALFDRDDASFQLMAIDDKGTPEGARSAAEQALRDGAELVLGPLFAGSVTAAADVTRAANVPLIAFSNDRQVAGRGVYLMSYLPEEEVDRVVGYAARQGKRSLAALLPDDAYGTALEQALQAAVAKSGGSLVAVERYPVNANGMVEPARRLVEQIKLMQSEGRPLDALFLPGGHDTLAQLGPVLTYAGLSAGAVQILGTGGMDHPNLGKETLFRGAWFAGTEPQGWQDFSARFAKTFGYTPPRVAALAYDAVTVAVTLAREPSATRYAPANLLRPAGFQGVDGSVRLQDNGTASRGLAILEVQEIGASVVEAAPGATAGAPYLSGQAAQLPQPAAQGGRLN